jgi:N-acetylglucosaminyldiphosphoundecaprenol N-acetyl-beta-D-mannosaminyltransferase
MNTAASQPAIPRRLVGSLDFTVLPLKAAIQLILAIGISPQTRGTAIHFANAYNIALADTDAHYRHVMQQGDYIFTDGTPVVWAGRRLHPDQGKIWERVYGPDVMAGVMAGSTDHGPKHYLLGASEGTLHLLTERLKTRWPRAQIVGNESPPFRAATGAELIERDQRIANSGATCVWVGLGTPKQDYEAQRLAQHLPVTALAIGAAFDFLAGTVPQAPSWMQRSGLEWSYRLAQEPRRLAKRYFWGNPRFIASVARQHFQGR